jgi:DNA-directed RNA polymerase specialized sigma24 family protein
MGADRARRSRRAARSADVDLLDLDAALSELALFDPRKSRVVELKFFSGLSLDDSAQALGISRATAERDWQVARTWLYRRLNPGQDRHDA